ncbi:glomulin [Bombus vosnesenskii]|uniref:Glomulin n=1 Tax=Bombus vosnesenskii TaxID=207650 RepID=A0A6J3KP03_9HYME|nr:glomulin [Bombus vosnesenskii]
MTERQENLTKKFVKELTDNLKENKFEEVLHFFEGNSYDDIIRESSWDIVPIILSYLTMENIKCNGNLVECCTIILNAIVEKCNPSETVLELLEQVEGPEDDIKFSIILSVLIKCLSKMDNKMKAIEWCISTIKSYIESLPIPEKDSQDYIIITNKVKNIYNEVILFLEPLINESRLGNSKTYTILRDYLASILIFLMGKPLIYLQEKELESCSSKPLPERIVILVSQVTGDLLSFLNITNVRSRKSMSKKKNIEEESCNLKVTLFELNENISDLAYANFYFYVITKLHLWEKVPQVYDLQYVFQACIYLIVKLLQEQESTMKGLNFLDHLLMRLTRRSLTLQLLELNIFFELFNVLVNVMIYSNSNKERKKALNLFQNYIEMFDIQARYSIILYLYQTNEHSGLLSLTTGIFKTSIIECLQAKPPMPYFLGSNLGTLIKLACKLHHGSASDLVELCDEIITSLNLLRFLFIRDKQNQTGIWNLVNKLHNEYLLPLREGIDLSRAHWKVKIKDLEEQKKMHKITENIELEKSYAEITLTVGGEKLPAMPVPEKITFCYQALNGLDIMESILIRVNECIANNPFKQNINKIVSSE